MTVIHLTMVQACNDCCNKSTLFCKCCRYVVVAMLIVAEALMVSSAQKQNKSVCMSHFVLSHSIRRGCVYGMSGSVNTKVQGRKRLMLH